MADTEATIQARLDAVNAEIDAVIADSDGKLLDYSHGGVRFGKAARLRELRLLRKEYIEELGNLPVCEETVLDHPDV